MSTHPDNLEPTYKPSARIAELPATASVEDILSVLDRDGGLILTDFLSAEQLASIESETRPYVNKKQDVAGYSIVPKETVVLNGIVGKSPTMAAVCEHPHLVSLRERILTLTGSISQEEASFDYRIEPLLSVSLSFRIGSGAPRQRLHRDDCIFLADHSRSDKGSYSLRDEVQFACLIAACETRQENGATMFVPGSHRWDHKRQPRLDEITFAEMKPGSALIFLGGAYHGGGHNGVHDFVRVVHGLFFCRGNLRTEENQFLAIPRSKVLKMSPAMQALLGYKLPEFCSLGLFEGGDPMADLDTALTAASY